MEKFKPKQELSTNENQESAFESINEDALENTEDPVEQEPVITETQEEKDEKILEVEQELEQTLKDNNLEKSLSFELKQKIESFENNFSVPEMNKIFNKLNVGTLFHKISEYGTNHIFYKKTLLGHKKLLNEVETDRFNKALKMSFEIQKMADPNFDDSPDNLFFNNGKKYNIAIWNNFLRAINGARNIGK